jgi:receptor protein-tyrosine kinase
VPTAPVSPKPLRNGLLGLVAGLIFGTAVAFVSDYVDDSIKTKEDVERAVPGLPVLGMIPTVPGWRNVSDTRLVSLAEPQSPAAEAYRITRTAIQFLALDRPLRVLQVTSPRASEGKTTTMANLAVALARAGQSVLLASCDLRRPRIHAFFGLPNDIGFTSVLLGETTLTAALQQVPGEPRLHLLASGPIPPDPAEFLSSPRASAVLTSLHEHADIVLVDSPPVLPVTDAAVLSGVVDGTLVVAMAGSTARPQLARTVEMLRQVNAPLLGVILNATAAEDVYAYRYEYRENAEPRRPGLRGRFGAPGNGSGPAPAPAPAGGATPGAGNGSGVPGPAPTGGGAVQEVGP